MIRLPKRRHQARNHPQDGSPAEMLVPQKDMQAASKKQTNKIREGQSAAITMIVIKYGNAMDINTEENEKTDFGSNATGRKLCGTETQYARMPISQPDTQNNAR